MDYYKEKIDNSDSRFEQEDFGMNLYKTTTDHTDDIIVRLATSESYLLIIFNAIFDDDDIFELACDIIMKCGFLLTDSYVSDVIESLKKQGFITEKQSDANIKRSSLDEQM